MGGATTQSTAAATTTTAPAVPASAAGDIKPYRIHMSSRYLELTKQKLELSRLPHEGKKGQSKEAGQSKEWWEPKAQIESLIDFWLEQFSWRAQESVFNSTLPQFRALLHLPTCPSTLPDSTPTPTRIHLIHARSPHPAAVPLLLIPPFPFSNLSIGHLIKDLADPADPAQDPPFHVVCPSLPGIAFSDALPSNTPMVATTAHLFDDLMKKLAYPVYLASNSGPGVSSPAQVDWKIARRLATKHADSCVGVHMIAPPFTAPQRKEAFVEWAKWSVARRIRRPMFKYSHDDFAALKRSVTQAPTVRPEKRRRAKTESVKELGIGALLGSFDPNALAYALCDSPTGFLVMVLKLLRTLGPRHEFSQTDILNFTEIAWLPGPEGILRFWAHCARDNDEDEDSHVAKGKETKTANEGQATTDAEAQDQATAGKDTKKGKPKKQPKATKPVIGITMFLGGDIEQPQSEASREAEAEGEQLSEAQGASGAETTSSGVHPKPVHAPYACPSWGEKHFNIMYVSRVSGQPGLLAWERPAVVVEGIRELVKRIIVHDDRLKSLNTTGTTTAVPTPEAAAVAVGGEATTTTTTTTTTTPSALTSALAKPSTTAASATTSSKASAKPPSPRMSTIPIGFIPDIIEELDESQPAVETTKANDDKEREPGLLDASRDGKVMEGEGRNKNPDTVVMAPLEQAAA